MGTTPTGLPYPEPTDPVAAGADAIKALALAVNGHVRRIGFGAVNAGWAIGVGTTGSMTWPTENYDTDGFAAGGAAITVPAGLGGLYMIAATINGLVVNAGGITTVQVVTSGNIAAQSFILVGVNSTFVSTIMPMNPGENAQIQIVNGHSGAGMTYNGRVSMVRISP